MGACQPQAEPCRNSSMVLLCDADPDCQAGGTLTATDEPNPSQYPNWAIGGWCLVQTPGQGAPVWAGGSVVLGPDPACPTSPSGDTMRTIGVRLKAGSPTATAPVPLSVSVRVTNNGPNPGVVGDGRFGLWNAATGTRMAHTDVKNSAPVGHQQTLTLSANVPAAALAAGQIVAVLDVETYQGAGGKAWTIDQFQWSATVPQVECEAEFLRTLTTDCETGEVVSTTDTTLDGAPYTPTGVVGQCTVIGGSAPTDCRNCDQVVLCDTTGTESHTFLRTVCRDCNGTVLSTTDTELDGATPYAVAGTVGQCATPPANCEAAAVQAFRLCDLNPAVEPDANGLRCATPFLRHFVYACDGTATFHDTAADGVTPYTPTQVVECGENPPSLREQVWNTLSIAPDPADTTNRVFIYTVANSEDPTQTGTVKMTASKAYGGGCGGTPTAPVWNAAVTFTFEPDAAVLAKADVLRVDAIDWDTWEDIVIPSGSPLPDKIESDTGHTQVSSGRWHSTISNNTGHFYFNGPPAVVRMTTRNDGGGNACTAPAFGFITLVPGPPCGVVPEVDHIVQPLCDVAAAGTTPFLRHWNVDNSSGQLTRLLDTRLDGTTSYTTTGTVTVCGQEADQPVQTGVRRVTGTTTVQNLKTEFPGLQSVSMTVVAGSVNVAMSSGTSQPVPAGASVTWSVADTDDSSLAAASFGGTTTAADYLLNWTYKAGAAG
ncbi:hypothetical protein ACFY20_26290 [Streptomyces sp. NPDC001312]|uniref:hypothetical protein n=1 Tax=Streptomyces sp. NPDC001312 TaxID=3364561 RepID=UPI0036CFD233